MIRENYYPILVKYCVATTVGNSENAIYSNWNITYALKENPTGYVERLVYGIELDFDRIIVLDASDNAKKIKENSIFLINDYPTENNKGGNYIVSKIFPEYLGKIMIALKASKHNSYPRLYYLDNISNKIYAYQLNFDYKTMKGYVGKYDTIPFNNDTKIWYREPIDENELEYQIKLVSTNKIGIVKNLKTFKELIFNNA